MRSILVRSQREEFPVRREELVVLHTRGRVSSVQSVGRQDSDYQGKYPRDHRMASGKIAERHESNATIEDTVQQVAPVKAKEKLKAIITTHLALAVL